MSTEEVIKALEQVKAYCASNLLDPLDYALHVFKHFKRAGIEDPVHADFSKLTPNSNSQLQSPEEKK